MRVLFIITIILFLSSCGAQAPDCLKSAGDRKIIEIEVPVFNSLEVNNEFNVFIKEGPSQKISLEGLENLIPEIDIRVTDGALIISDNNSCKWVRSYEYPTVYITHPNLSNIRQNGGGQIESIDTLHYPDISLISENSSGDFRLAINNSNLTIVNNDLSNYYISGQTDELIVGFYAGDGRFEGENLAALNTNVFHRGTNEIIVNTSDSLLGRLLSTGNLIYVRNKPQVIDVSFENRGELVDGTK